MSKISIKQISSLEKVMLRDTFDKREMSTATVLKGERFSYQIMYSTGSDVKIDAVIEVKSELKNLVTIRKVGMVPSEVPAYDYRHDEDFISLEPGLFPDPLYPMEYKEIEVIPYRCHSLWVTVEIDDIIEAGKYDIEICFVNSEMEIFESATMQLEVIDAILQKQELIYTQWFHGDCIASYYNIPMFSEEHWRRMEQFVKMAVKEGINMILTPIFTPPLDTKVGGERPTIQLVGVKKSENTYIFDFTKLKRWVDMCLENGIEYFEMSHLFTQWGAEFTPKIMAEINGEEKKIFGWEVRANSEEYLEFLDQFLPSLVAFLKQENIADKTYFHVSDEPEQKHLESYKFAASVLEKYLKEFKVFDAMSDYNFYKHGLTKKPVPGTDSADVFIENQVKDLWIYYCCGQCVENLSNRYMSMPSYRNRIIGLQMYKYDIAGFLHWGFNFYYSQFSKYKINPFLTTDAIGAFPSGDAFSVYPYEKGPIESLRAVVFYEALQDLRAMKLLETFIGKDEVLELVGAKQITLKNYPKGADYILEIRNKINNKIKELI